MKYALLVIELLFVFSNRGFSQTVSTNKRTVTKISEGVYVVRHKDAPDGNPQGNTAIIIGDKDIIVVDACYLPSSAREDIQMIKKLTSKPVAYLINTHWHADHQQGNPEYIKAFPKITIIAHKETAKEMLGFETKDLARYRQSLSNLRNKIKAGKNDNGKAFTAAELKDLQQQYAAQDSVALEFYNYKPVYPTKLLTASMNLNTGNEEAQILYLGPVHTIGDIMVYLPKKKILIAGDVIVSPVPYFFGGGYPYSGLKILEAINKMDIKTIVPGHGEILNDKVYLNQEIGLLKNTISSVEAEVYKQGLLGIKLENIQKAINLSSYRKQFTKGNKENEEFFDESISKGLVEGCFNGMAK
jgi:glyoxylase-like metal-dependent hydrolase (beta-lactamase superfamily II)